MESQVSMLSKQSSGRRTVACSSHTDSINAYEKEFRDGLLEPKVLIFRILDVAGDQCQCVIATAIAIAKYSSLYRRIRGLQSEVSECDKVFPRLCAVDWYSS